MIENGRKFSAQPESESLKKTMENSCESLCGHVQREATAYKAIPSEQDSDAKQEKTKEVHIIFHHLPSIFSRT